MFEHRPSARVAPHGSTPSTPHSTLLPVLFLASTAAYGKTLWPNASQSVARTAHAHGCVPSSGSRVWPCADEAGGGGKKGRKGPAAWLACPSRRGDRSPPEYSIHQRGDSPGGGCIEQQTDPIDAHARAHARSRPVLVMLLAAVINATVSNDGRPGSFLVPGRPWARAAPFGNRQALTRVSGNGLRERRRNESRAGVALVTSARGRTASMTVVSILTHCSRGAGPPTPRTACYSPLDGGPLGVPENTDGLAGLAWPVMRASSACFACRPPGPSLPPLMQGRERLCG